MIYMCVCTGCPRSTAETDPAAAASLRPGGEARPELLAH